MYFYLFKVDVIIDVNFICLQFIYIYVLLLNFGDVYCIHFCIVALCFLYILYLVHVYCIYFCIVDSNCCIVLYTLYFYYVFIYVDVLM